MGRTGTCYDNAVAESFFATFKKELIHTKPWPTLKRLRRERFLWIEIYYNTPPFLNQLLDTLGI